MDFEEFRGHGHTFVDWMADYLEGIEQYPVRSKVRPGDIANELPWMPPDDGEDMADIFADFQNIVMPGITHWQHPKWFAFFPANSSPPSVLAEMLMAVIGANCMMWETSPAGTELEERMMEWLGQMVGLPPDFKGVIQDTASAATFCAVLAARERATDWKVNEKGLSGGPQLTYYTSEDAHSSVEKAIRMAGIGSENLRKIPVDTTLSMDERLLEPAIEADIAAGLKPAGIIATLGTTGVGGMDRLLEIGDIAKKYDLYLHVDAAWAGSALLLQEYRSELDEFRHVDSFVFNPHKWLMTNFDCSAHFVRDPEVLKRTLSMTPEYLKTREGDAVTDYRDWGLPLGRRFRALKLWFVIRSYGHKGLSEIIRRHIDLAGELAKTVDAEAGFELVTPAKMALFTFRATPDGMSDADEVDAFNERLLLAINDDGCTYLTRTIVQGRMVIRFSVGAAYTERRHVFEAWDDIKRIAGDLTS